MGPEEITYDWVKVYALNETDSSLVPGPALNKPCALPGEAQKPKLYEIMSAVSDTPLVVSSIA